MLCEFVQRRLFESERSVRVVHRRIRVRSSIFIIIIITTTIVIVVRYHREGGILGKLKNKSINASREPHRLNNDIIILANRPRGWLLFNCRVIIPLVY